MPTVGAGWHVVRGSKTGAKLAVVLVAVPMHTSLTP
jgi:hypothetical protein